MPATVQRPAGSQAQRPAERQFDVTQIDPASVEIRRKGEPREGRPERGFGREMEYASPMKPKGAGLDGSLEQIKGDEWELVYNYTSKDGAKTTRFLSDDEKKAFLAYRENLDARVGEMIDAQQGQVVSAATPPKTVGELEQQAAHEIRTQAEREGEQKGLIDEQEDRQRALENATKAKRRAIEHLRQKDETGNPNPNYDAAHEAIEEALGHLGDFNNMERSTLYTMQGDAYRHEADEARRAGNAQEADRLYRQAEGSYSSALENDRHNTGALNGRGISRHRTGNNQGALEDFRTAEGEIQEEIDARQQMIEGMKADGLDTAGAQEKLKRAHEKQRTYQNNKAVVEWHMNEPGAAEGDIDRAAAPARDRALGEDLTCENSVIHKNREIIKRRLGKTREADEAAKEAERTRQAAETARQQASTVAIEEKKTEAATAPDEKPKEPVMMGQTQTEWTKRYDDRVNALGDQSKTADEKMAALSDSGRQRVADWMKQGLTQEQAFERERQFNEMRRDVHVPQMFGQQPAPEAMVKAGRFVNREAVDSFNRGDYQTAIDGFQEAANLHPASSTIRSNLAHAQYRMAREAFKAGDKQAAANHLQAAQENADMAVEMSGGKNALALNLRGCIDAARGDYQDASGRFQTAIEMVESGQWTNMPQTQTREQVLDTFKSNKALVDGKLGEQEPEEKPKPKPKPKPRQEPAAPKTEERETEGQRGPKGGAGLTVDGEVRAATESVTRDMTGPGNTFYWTEADGREYALSRNIDGVYTVVHYPGQGQGFPYQVVKDENGRWVERKPKNPGDIDRTGVKPEEVIRDAISQNNPYFYYTDLYKPGVSPPQKTFEGTGWDNIKTLEEHNFGVERGVQVLGTDARYGDILDAKKKANADVVLVGADGSRHIISLGWAADAQQSLGGRDELMGKTMQELIDEFYAKMKAENPGLPDNAGFLRVEVAPRTA